MWAILFVPIVWLVALICPVPKQHTFPPMRAVFVPGIYQPQEESVKIHDYGYDSEGELP